MLGGKRPEVLSGVSLGIEKQIEPLLDQIERFLEEGYRRIKLKIAPGRDVEVVRAVRERFPKLPLQVDANSAYTLDDLPGSSSRRLRPAFDRAAAGARRHHRPCPAAGGSEDADLSRREHPLGRRRARPSTWVPAGLSTSRSAAWVVCVRRRGARPLPHAGCAGLVRRHARVRDRPGGQCRNRPLPGFTIAGDVSGSDKYYASDIVDPPILARERGDQGV